MIRFNTEVIGNGDYIADEHGRLLLDDYSRTILQDLARAVGTDRGSFYPDKRFGGFSDDSVQAVPLALYAAARARQALYGLSGIYVDGAEERNGGLILNLVINKEKRQVEITF